MIEASGGLANFIAILIPALMGGFYGYRCLFLSDGFIDQYGLGASLPLGRSKRPCSLCLVIRRLRVNGRKLKV